jgi:hypothetical protein
MFEFGPNFARGAPAHIERATGLSQNAGYGTRQMRLMESVGGR